MNDETLQRLRAHRQTDIARALGLSVPSVWRWFRTGRVPAERVVDLERVTGIPRADLRPDLYPSTTPPALTGELMDPPPTVEARHRAATRTCAVCMRPLPLVATALAVGAVAGRMLRR